MSPMAICHAGFLAVGRLSLQSRGPRGWLRSFDCFSPARLRVLEVEADVGLERGFRVRDPRDRHARIFPELDLLETFRTPFLNLFFFP